MMKRSALVSSHLADFLTYYPGRSRLTLVWLLLVPAGAVFIASEVLGRTGSLPSDAMPHHVFSVAGQSVMWLYIPAVLACLLKINRARIRSALTHSAVGIGVAVWLWSRIAEGEDSGESQATGLG